MLTAALRSARSFPRRASAATPWRSTSWRGDQEVLAASTTASADSLRDLAVTIHRTGLLYSDIGKPAEAEAEYRAAQAIRKKLADANPGVTEFRGNLADSHVELGNILSDTGKSAEAQAELRQALALYQKLSRDHPAVIEFRAHLAGGHVCARLRTVRHEQAE